MAHGPLYLYWFYSLCLGAHSTPHIHCTIVHTLKIYFARMLAIICTLMKIIIFRHLWPGDWTALETVYMGKYCGYVPSDSVRAYRKKTPISTKMQNNARFLYYINNFFRECEWCAKKKRIKNFTHRPCVLLLMVILIWSPDIYLEMWIIEHFKKLLFWGLSMLFFKMPIFFRRFAQSSRKLIIFEGLRSSTVKRIFFANYRNAFRIVQNC